MIVLAGSTDCDVPDKGDTEPLTDMFEFDFSASWFKQARPPRHGRAWLTHAPQLPCRRRQHQAAPPHRTCDRRGHDTPVARAGSSCCQPAGYSAIGGDCEGQDGELGVLPVAAPVRVPAQRAAVPVLAESTVGHVPPEPGVGGRAGDPAVLGLRRPQPGLSRPRRRHRPPARPAAPRAAPLHAAAAAARRCARHRCPARLCLLVLASRSDAQPLPDGSLRRRGRRA